IHETGLFLPNVVDEATYERCIQSLAPRLFPDYWWCPFKAEVRHPDGLVHADAALIAQDYSRWYVVEVELASHRWEDHIKPQLTKLSQGIFQEVHRARLIENQPHLAQGAIKDLDIYTPEVALIIDSASPATRKWCRSQGIFCMEAALFKSSENDVVLAVSGDEPSELVQAVPRLVGRATLAGYSADVPMLVYDFGSEVSDLTTAFSVEVSGSMIAASNFGVKPRGIAIHCSKQEFAEIYGEAVHYDFFKLGPNAYRLSSRS
ncbi:MAG TPA: hypothetical protein VFR81_26730, partial [Longimicrobium sp.]|nr:hypothetical protein [Longimicrobium sp.]